MLRKFISHKNEKIKTFINKPVYLSLSKKKISKIVRLSFGTITQNQNMEKKSYAYRTLYNVDENKRH